MHDKLFDFLIRSAAKRFRRQEQLAASFSSDLRLEKEINGRLYIIRRMMPSDVNPLYELALELHRTAIGIAPGAELRSELLEIAHAYPQSYSNTHVIETQGEPVGLLQYSVYFNFLQQELVVENENIVVLPEHRSYLLFKEIIRFFERLACDADADRLIIGYDNGESPEQKRTMTLRLGFKTMGSILVKDVEGSGHRALEARPKLSLASARYYNRSRKMPLVDSAFFFLGTWARLRQNYEAGQRFLELGPTPDSPYRFISAKSARRKPDGIPYIFTDGFASPTKPCLEILEDFARQESARYITINLTSTYDDAEKALPDFEAHGYRRVGYVLSKSRERLGQSSQQHHQG